MTTAAPGWSESRTSPVTSVWVAAKKASYADRTGLNQSPSYSTFAHFGSSSRFAIASAFVSTTSSSAR